MPLRDRAETAAAAGLLLMSVAFAVSFGFGLRRAGTAPPVDADSTMSPVYDERAVGRIEVLNASGRSGLARAATGQLRDGGFDVVFFGNASGYDGDSSIVIDRTGSPAVAQAAARHLSISRTRTERDTALFLDATVVIGRDWPPRREAAPAPDASWRSRMGRWLRPSR
jgi:hypothetical protein